MSISFEGQVAIVTGAGRGLGRAYALELASAGARVVVNDLGANMDGEASSATPAEEVCAEIRANGGEAVPNLDSVATMEGGEGIVKTALETWGRVDAIVCNAGILRDRTLHKMSESDWDAVLQVHLKGCFTVLRAAWPTLREQRYGRIVLATSTTGLYGNFGQANDGAAKAGMIGLMNVLKLEGEKYGIGVNLIAPSAATRMTEGLMTPEQLANFGPEHVAPVVTYLASRECTDTGWILQASAGHFCRVAVLKGRGVSYDPAERPDVAWVAGQWDAIANLEGAQPMWALIETLEDHLKRR